MCFQPLIDNEEASKPPGEIVRGELWGAFREGVLAAGIVLVVLVVNGTPPLLVGGATVGAFVLAILLHETLLVVGLGVRRLVRPQPDGAGGPT